MTQSILIFGTGSIGTIYTWVLSQAIPESHITAVCRSNYDVASRDGFTINSKVWGDGLRVRPRVVRSVSKAAAAAAENQEEGFNFIVVATKAVPQNPPLAESLRPAITPGKTAIVLLQNGIGIEEEYVRCFKNAGIDAAVISVVVYIPATQIAPGVVEHGTKVQHLHVGTYPAKGEGVKGWHKERAKGFVDLLHQAGAGGTLHDDVQGKRWGKLLMNASWNPICALTRLRCVEFALSGGEDEDQKRDTEATRLVRDVMREVVSVARACGYGHLFDDGDGGEEKVIDTQLEINVGVGLPGNQPSMLADVVAGNGALEVDALLGNLVKIAREKGVDVPIVRTLWLLARGLSVSLSAAR